MDECILAQSNEVNYKDHPFVAKQVVSVIDSNGGSYTNQIKFDLSSLANSGKFCSWSEAYIEIPVIMTLQGANAASAGFAARTNLHYAMGIKNGFYQLIHSVSIEYNNTTVVQGANFNNILTNFKLLTTMSKDDLEKHGPSIGFYPDTSTSWRNLNGNANNDDLLGPNGLGVSNNAPFGWEKLYPSNDGIIYTDTATNTGVNPFVAAAGRFVVTTANTAAGDPLSGIYTNKSPLYPSSSTVGNYGFYKRMQFCNFDPTVSPYSDFITTANTQTVLKNYYANLGADNAAYKAWFVMARIRLKDISDFFAKLPLVRGSYIKITLNINTGSQTLVATDMAAAAGTPAGTSLVATAAPILSQSTLPFMVSSTDLGQGLRPTSARLPTTSQYTAQIAIVNSVITGVTVTHPQRFCTINVPLYQFSPQAEIEYLANNKNKKVIYLDNITFDTPVAPGQSFTTLINNGQPACENVIVVPFIDAGTTAADGNRISLRDPNIRVPAYQSCFASEPGTSSFGVLTDFNVQIAGVNVFLDPIKYDYSAFADELSHMNSLNGACTTGLASGLISELDFTNIYRYYVVNVSRRLEAETTIPKSIQVTGKNLTLKYLKLIIFVEIAKSITIDVSNGARIEEGTITA